MAPSLALSDYPGLSRWFRERAAPAADGPPPEYLVWRTCEALSTDAPAVMVKRWLEGFQGFLAQTGDALEDFLGAEAIVHRCDAELLDLIGELGELAIRGEHAAGFATAMRAGADRTGLVVLRFLSAWTALNTGNLLECVAECEKVDEPFGALYTVHGQALLELGRSLEATEVLEVAVKLAPGEILAWFQLAKAYHVDGKFAAAFAPLRECRRLAPQSDEVALYMGLIALDAPDEPMAREALMALRPLLKRHADNPTVVYTLLRLACRASEKPVCAKVLDETAWPRLLGRPESLANLPPVLRALQAAGWMDVAAALLAHVTPANSNAS